MRTSPKNLPKQGTSLIPSAISLLRRQPTAAPCATTIPSFSRTCSSPIDRRTRGPRDRRAVPNSRCEWRHRFEAITHYHRQPIGVQYTATKPPHLWACSSSLEQRTARPRHQRHGIACHCRPITNSAVTPEIAADIQPVTGAEDSGASMPRNNGGPSMQTAPLPPGDDPPPQESYVCSTRRRRRQSLGRAVRRRSGTPGSHAAEQP